MPVISLACIHMRSNVNRGGGGFYRTFLRMKNALRRRYKPVANSSYSFNVIGLSRRVTQRIPQLPYGRAEVVVEGDEGAIRPDHSVEMATCTNSRLIQRRELDNQRMARVSCNPVSTKGWTEPLK